MDFEIMWPDKIFAKTQMFFLGFEFSLFKFKTSKLQIIELMIVFNFGALYQPIKEKSLSQSETDMMIWKLALWYSSSDSSVYELFFINANIAFWSSESCFNKYA